MTPSEIRALIEVKPFKPFKIGTADGTSIPVPHGDHISLSPSGWQALVWKPRGGHWLIDVGSITFLDISSRPHARVS